MGTVVVSVDAELSNHRQPTEREKRRARYGWRRLVNLFETYDVPATWAVVGRLCTDGNQLDEPSGDRWFTDDAVASLGAEPSSVTAERRALNRRLTGRHLVDALVASPVDHDIGSHSYSHPRFTNVTREFAAADVAAAVDALADWESGPASFVYPFNAIRHRDVLADFGFTCYRGTTGTNAGQESPAPDRFPLHPLELVPDDVKWRAGWAIDRLSEAVSFTVGSDPPPLVQPERDDSELVAVPASMASLYRMPVGLRRALRAAGQYPLARAGKQGIDAAAERDGLFHCWFHPADFYDEADFESFERVLAHLHERRTAGDVEVETMANVAARVGV